MTKKEIRAFAHAKLQNIIVEYVAKSKNEKWANPTFAILQVEKGLRGEVGEDLTVELLLLAGYLDAKKNLYRSSRNQSDGACDVEANGLRIEVKTASE